MDSLLDLVEEENNPVREGGGREGGGRVRRREWERGRKGGRGRKK